MTDNLYREFKRTVREHQMIHSGDTIVAGVSGGADSVCLLFLLCELRKELPFSLRAVHVNHMIRAEEADRDEAFVRDLCRDADVPLFCERADVPLLAKERKQSEEETGRQVRYEAFFRICKEGKGKIALAHHKEDNAETVLLNLIRGSGIRGISGMKPVSEQQGISVIRPLLFTDRSQILRCLEQNGRSFCEDSTNAEEAYSRNALRLKVFPELRKINERASSHITKTAEMLGEIEAFLEEKTEAAFAQCITSEGEETVLLLPELNKIEPLLQKRIALQAIAEAAGGRKDITSAHVLALLQLSKLQSGKKADLPGDLFAVRQYDEIRIRRKKETRPARPLEIRKEEIGEEGSEVLLATGERALFRKKAVNNSNYRQFMEKNLYTKAFDYDKIVGVIKVGEKVPGDYIVLKSGRKTLKKLFIDDKIPEARRRTLPVFKDDESVIWVVGSRISEKHKISVDTKTALIIEICKGEEA